MSHQIRSWVAALVLLTLMAAAAGARTGTETDDPVPPDGAVKNAPMNGNGEGETIRMTDIHDIKPIERPFFLPRWVFWAVGGLLVLLLLAAAATLWRRRRRRAALPEAPPRPPEEIAREGLGELQEVERIDGRRFYFRLSEILRAYMEGRYGFPALEMTTEELLPRLRDLGLSEPLREGAGRLFRTADPVKFANERAVEARMREDLAFAHRFVGETAAPEAGADPAKTTGGTSAA